MAHLGSSPAYLGLFTHEYLNEMHNCKYHRAIDYTLPFFADFSDLFLASVATHEQTTSKSRYKDLRNISTCDVDDLHSYKVCQGTIEDLNSTIKRTILNKHAAHC